MVHTCYYRAPRPYPTMIYWKANTGLLFVRAFLGLGLLQTPTGLLSLSFSPSFRLSQESVDRTQRRSEG